MTSYEFKALEAAAAAELGSIGKIARNIIHDALVNANETDGTIIESDAYYGIAAMGICFSPSFQENKEVRDWFSSQGYR